MIQKHPNHIALGIGMMIGAWLMANHGSVKYRIKTAQVSATVDNNSEQ